MMPAHPPFNPMGSHASATVPYAPIAMSGQAALVPMNIPPPSMLSQSVVQSSSDWTKHNAPDGRIYYFNQKTNESRWDKPDELKTDAEISLSQCAWKEFKTDDNKVFYHNAVTKESAWTMPKELEEIMAKCDSVNNGNNSPPSPSPFDGPSIHAKIPTAAMSDSSSDQQDSNASDMTGSQEVDKNIIFSLSQQSTASGSTQSIASPKDVPPLPLNNTDILDVFKELCREKNVPSNSSWEYCLKLIGADKRYELFRHHPERKQMFNSYKTQKAKDEKEEQRLRIKRAKENLEKFFQTSEKMSSTTKYRQAVEMFSDLDVWKIVADADRREIFEDSIVYLAKKEKESAKNLRKRNMRVLADILDSMTSINFRTTWQEAQQQLLDNPVFSDDQDLLGMDKEDALIVFEEHIRQLEKEEEEEKQRELKRNSRQQRKNRQNFIAFLDELHVQGKLTSMSKWSNLYHEISADPRFTAMLSQPCNGSTPLDLFKFYLEDLKARYEDEKQVINDILKGKNFEVNIHTTYEEFVNVISEDDISAKLDVGNVKMVYERLKEKALEKEKERLKEEQKARKKLELGFQTLMSKLDPMPSTWEEVRKTIHQDDAFLAIPTEAERMQLFKSYLQTLEESCSHHHSKTKKQRKQVKKQKRQSSSSRSSSEINDRDNHYRHGRHSSQSSSQRRRKRSSRSRSESRSSTVSSSRSRSHSRSLSRSRSRSVVRSRSRSASRSRSRSRSYHSDRHSRGGSNEGNHRAKYEKGTKRQRCSSESEEERQAPPPRKEPEEKTKPAGGETEADDNLEDLERQRNILLQQLAAHR